MDAQQTSPKYEIVHTVTDYYDGPRQGIANYRGVPHFYECIFDPDKDDYSDLYRLTPLDESTFQLAMEGWAIWKRWEHAFYAGKTTIATHPALPEDAAWHKELKQALDGKLQSSPDAIIRLGKFIAVENTKLQKGRIRPLQVQWSDP
jgi:hypothetical protein